MGFLAYMMDTRFAIERPNCISDVPILYEFPDVFHEELMGVPPERQVEF